MFWYKHCSLCCSSSVQNALLIIEIHLIFPLSIYIYVSSVHAGLYLHFYVLTLGWCTCVDASTVCDWGVDNVQTVNLFFFFYLVAIVWITISIHIFNCRKAHEKTSKCFLFFRITHSWVSQLFAFSLILKLPSQTAAMTDFRCHRSRAQMKESVVLPSLFCWLQIHLCNFREGQK